MKIKTWIKSHLLPYRPLKVNRERWEEQFRTGHWNYLKNIDQMPRYSVIAGYIEIFFPGSASVLDLGCGYGILYEKVRLLHDHYYLGVDISQEAINHAVSTYDKPELFICEDIEKYDPKRKFDVIIFNESLYYIDNPVGLVERYFNYLTDGGYIIISMWDYKERNNKIWKLLDKKFSEFDGIYYRHISGKSWYIKVFKK